MFTSDPADKHYGEKRQLTPGVHTNQQGFALAKSASLDGSSNPAMFRNNPLNWQGFAPQLAIHATPYGDTTVVQEQSGMQLTQGAQQRVIPRLGLNQNIGATDSRVDVERPNKNPLGMNTGVKLGAGPQRNVPKA